MGKAGKWLRSFLPGRRGRDKAAAGALAPAAAAAEPDDLALALALPLPLPGNATTTPASTPGAKEKRRWSFRRPSPAAASPGSLISAAKDAAQAQGRRLALAPYYGFQLEPRVDPDQHAVAVAIATAAAAEAAVAAKQAAAAAVRLSASKRTVVIGIEDAAAIKIQAAFRSYLARKALCALRGLVKLQALVRGHLVRRQASHTLRCMQAIVAAQNRARAARLRMLELDVDDDKPLHRTTPTPTRRSSPQSHPRPLLRHHHQDVAAAAEENVKIVEVDTGAGGGHCTPRTSRRSSCYATPLCRTPSKNELYYQKISPTPSARTYSGRYDDDDFSFATARATPYRYAPSSRQHHGDEGADTDKPSAEHHPLLVVPSYMANTESSRAKARSQSAPRQRLSVSSSSAAAAAGEAAWRRRASLEAQATPGARGSTRHAYGPARVPRCPSQASAPGGGASRLVDRWSASAHDSECGSTSTVLTAATTTYCWSLTADNAGMA